MLIVSQGFTWTEFVVALTGCVLGILVLGAALTGFMFAGLRRWHRWTLGIGSLFLFAPGVQSGVVGIVICAPAIIAQLRLRQVRRAAPDAVPIPEAADSSE